MWAREYLPCFQTLEHLEIILKYRNYDEVIEIQKIIEIFTKIPNLKRLKFNPGNQYPCNLGKYFEKLASLEELDLIIPPSQSKRSILPGMKDEYEMINYLHENVFYRKMKY